MSESENRSKRRPPLKKLPPENFLSKAWLVWLAIIAAVLALLYWRPDVQTGPATLKIQRVVELAEQGKIREGTIRPDTSGGRDGVLITGESADALEGGAHQFRA